MMKFLKLLDYRDSTVDGSGMTIAQQSLRARELFPALVNQSSLRYWKPGMKLPLGKRLLLGLAPTFSLADLRLADLVNELMTREPRADLRVDVFDIDDSGPTRDFTSYFPDLTYLPPSPPFVGLWENGMYSGVSWGANGIDQVLKTVGIPITSEELLHSVRPPSPEMLDD